MNKVFLCAVAAIAIAVITTGCARSTGGNSQGPSRADSIKMANKSSAPAELSAYVLWMNANKTDKTIAFVARISNSNRQPISGAVLSERAVDSTGSIVGSNKIQLPTVPASGHLDYVDGLGDAFTELSAPAAKVIVSVTGGVASSGQELPLRTSDLAFKSVSPEQEAESTPFAYAVTVKVTNNLSAPIGGDAYSVEQQAIAYNSAGQIIGAMNGGSDNVPDHLAAGESYIESTDVGTTAKAAAIKYTVWQAL